MALKYVRKSGSDSNGGTSPTDAWLTIGKAIGASGAASGDTVYVGAGIYREVPTITLAPSATTTIHGDVTGQYTGDAGEVRLTAYTTNDSTTPSSSVLLAPSTKNYYKWKNWTFCAGSNSLLTLGTSNNWTFEDCTFIGRIAGASTLITGTSAAGVNSTNTFTRCRFMVFGNSSIFVHTTTLHSADYFSVWSFLRCHFRYTGSNAIVWTATTSAGAGLAKGLTVLGCTFEGAQLAIQVSSAAHATTGSSALGNLFMCAGAAPMQGSSASQISADYNRSLGSASSYTTITSGANDLFNDTKAFTPDLGQSYLWTRKHRAFLTPMPGGPHLAFASSSGMPTYDLNNLSALSGGQSASLYAVGALALHDTGREASTITPDSGNALELVGYADQSFELPVTSGRSTTVRVKVQVSGYGGTDYPQLQVLNGGEAGVSDETASATLACASAFETIRVGPFTPTSDGIVTIRFINRTNNGTGVACFDTVTVT